jgi:hypothetical protein
MIRKSWASLAVFGLTLSATSAVWAQDTESAAGTDGNASAEASGSWSTSGSSDANANANATAPTTTASSPSPYAADTAAAPPPGGTDHAQVVGKLGVGYLGYRTITYGVDPGSAATASVEAPVIGVRYWMDPDMGLDLGLGLAIASASATAEVGGDSTDVDAPQPLGIVLHGGVPLALHSGRHFTFQVVPEMNIGYATNTTDDPEISQSGLHVDLGARVGAEIQFGFIGIPELSLQAGVGVGLAFDSQTAEQDDNSFSQSRTSFGTLTGENPWQIFQANVAALYYLGR